MAREAEPSNVGGQADADELLARAVTALAHGLVVYDDTGRTRSCNPQAAAIVGAAVAEVLAAPADAPPWRALDADGVVANPAADCLATGQAVHDLLLVFERRDAPALRVIATADPLPLPGRPRPGVVLALVDVTDRDALDDRYRKVFDAMQEGAMVLSETGELLAVNARGLELLGGAAGHRDLVGVDAYAEAAWRVYHPDGSVWEDDDLPSKIALRTGEVQRDVLMRAGCDGGACWLTLNAVPIRLPNGGKGVVTTFTDVTERRRAEEALLASERRAHLLADEHAALRRVAEAVARAADPAEVFSLVARGAAQAIGAQRAAIHPHHQPDASTVWTAPREPLPPQQASGPELRSEAEASGSISVPIRVGQRPWGVLVAGPLGDGADGEGQERLGRFADLAALAIGEAEARTRLHAHAARQEALRLVGEHVLALPLEEACAAIAPIIARAVRADFVGVTEIHGDELDGVAVWSRFELHAVPRKRLLLGDELVITEALAAGSAVSIPDIAADGRYASNPTVLEIGAVSAAAVPVAGPDAAWGGFTVFSRQRGRFGPDELVFLLAASATLSSAVARHRAEETIRHHAMYDTLTGIANRTLLTNRLAHALDRADRGQSQTAVLFCDIDDFRDVNDALGHVAGDELLVGVARRLADAVRPGDTVARLGGDEFVVICEDLAAEPEALGLAERLLDAIAQTDGGGRVGASMGVALCGPGDDPTRALRDAETAMYRAKAAGRGRIEVFDEAMRERLLARVQTHDDLRRALERNELLLHYQPIVAADTGAVVAVEGLARWQHPRRGLVQPGEFIGIAEETGLIDELGRFVIAQACADAARWNAARPHAAPLRVSVNLSPRQLGVGDLVGYIGARIAEWGLPAGQLGLEITESVLLDGDVEHARQLAAIRELGVRLLLDDFGTGYSSLGYIQRFPLDTLKLDRSFVAGLARGSKDATIVAAVVQMAQALGISVVAEGVETIDQAAQLRELGCQLLQGFYFSRPIPNPALEQLLGGGRPRDLPTRRAA